MGLSFWKATVVFIMAPPTLSLWKVVKRNFQTRDYTHVGVYGYYTYYTWRKWGLFEEG